MTKHIIATAIITLLVAANIGQAGYIYLIESGKVVKQCAFVDPLDTLIKGAK